MTIYPFKEESFVTKALSEKRISLDFIDVARKQNLEHFKNYKKPLIHFRADDFLILVDDDAESDLTTNRFIDFHQVIQFGWYYEKRHRINCQIFASSETTKIGNLLQLNPSIRINSFDRLRDDFQARKSLNVLSGALALCYHCFKADYDSFFSKMSFSSNSLKLRRDELDPRNDFVILLQLALIHNPQDIRTNRTLFPEEKGLHLLHDFLSVSLRYFSSHSYSMSDFLSFLSNELSQSQEYSTLNSGIAELKDQYVQKGLPVTPSNKLIAATKEFLDIAKTDSDKLRAFLDADRSYSKTAVFLLGMLHLGDRLEDQFAFDNFIPALVDVVIRFTREIRITPDFVEFELDEVLVQMNRNKKFSYVADYLSELREMRHSISEINRVKSTNVDLKTFLETDSSLASLRKELDTLIKEKTNVEAERGSLIQDITHLTNEIKTLQVERNERHSFHKELIKENEALTSKRSQLETENKKLKSKLDQITHEESDISDNEPVRRTSKPKRGKQRKAKASKETNELFQEQSNQSTTATSSADSTMSEEKPVTLNE